LAKNEKTNFLGDLVTNWEETDPKTLIDLLNAPYETLSSAAQALRKQAVDLVHSFERQPIYTAKDVLALLEKHHLPARKDKWVSIVLNKDKERVYVKTKRAMRLSHVTSVVFPSLANLENNAPLPEGGSYLIIYGGSVTDLAKYTSEFDKLRKHVNITDVLVWQYDNDGASFFSVRAGTGKINGRVATSEECEPLKEWNFET